MKFKKGDIVQVREWDEMVSIGKLGIAGDIYFDGITFVRDMKKYCNKVARIYGITYSGNYQLIFSGEKNKASYYFVNKMLEPPIDPIVVDSDYKYNEELL